MQIRYLLDEAHILDEYPRPQMMRSSYRCLNGIWECAITDTEITADIFPYSIVVPFSPETELSQVGKALLPSQKLTYRLVFSYDRLSVHRRLLLHFGAIDYACKVYLNACLVAEHTGGYLPFSCDVTESVEEKNTLIVLVTDPGDSEPIIKGKQRSHAHGIYYSGQSGIYQTVWLEEVPENYIKNLKITPNLEQHCWHVVVEAAQGQDLPVCIRYEGETKETNGLAGQRLCCQVDSVHPWSPEDPYLYSFTVIMGEDVVRSYVGLRSFSVQGGRLCLNGKPYFHHGILDQGYWPQSLYTPPTDQAMIDDILLAKKMGFNMIRKHAKVENLRWYYHCDRLGILVWQDMVSGGRNPFQPIMSLPLFLHSFPLSDTHYSLLGSQDETYRHAFEQAMEETICTLYNCVCIAMWVIFNEGWGQFDSERMLNMAKELDGTRTIDPVSGWYDQGVGEIASRHVYFTDYKHKRDRLGRCPVLSEFGGYVYRVPFHDEQDKAFGYRSFTDRQVFNEAFFELYQGQIVNAKQKGLSASVYTQLSDVQQELNGLVTYDRLHVKLDEVVALQVAALLLGT